MRCDAYSVTDLFPYFPGSHTGCAALSDAGRDMDHAVADFDIDRCPIDRLCTGRRYTFRYLIANSAPCVAQMIYWPSADMNWSGIQSSGVPICGQEFS